MRIAVCGVNNSELLNKVESHYNVESVSTIGTIYELAKVTYEHDNDKHVVYNGCALDCALNLKDIHPFDEQIILCALANLDVVYVNTIGMSTEEVNRYHQFDGFYPVKIVDVTDINTFTFVND